MDRVNRLSIICSFFICNLVHAMEVEGPFASLTSDLIGVVALQLVATVGTPEVINYKDLPVIVKNIRRLSSVNKHCHKTLTATNMVDLLIRAVAQRYAISNLAAALECNTKATNRWVKNFVQRSGDYALYKEQYAHQNEMKKLLIDKYHLEGELLTEMMELMQEMYDHERAPMRQPCQWMLIDKIRVVCRVCQSPKCGVYCTLCTTRGYCSKKCQINDWPQHAREVHTALDAHDTIMAQLQLVSDLSAIPAWGAYCADQLTDQPIFDGDASALRILNFNTQILSLADFSDAEIMTEMNDCTVPLLCDKAWKIGEFGFQFVDNLFDKKGNIVKPGLYADAYRGQCSLAELQKHYEIVINTIQRGWAKVKLRNYPEIDFMQSEEEWDLLIKPKSFSGEWRLLHYLGAKFGFTKKITVSDLWSVARSKKWEVQDLIYLWVKKKYVEAFQEIFQLQISDKQQSLVDFYKPINHINDIPSFLIYLAEKLDKQPIIQAMFYGPAGQQWSDNIKLLSLPLSARDNKKCEYVCHHMTAAATAINSKVCWLLHMVNSKLTTQLYTDTNERIIDGIFLYVDQYCDISQLREVYQEVINRVQQGWKSTSLIEYHDIKFAESEEQWHLFVKNKSFSHEVKLLLSIASLLGFSENIICSDKWLIGDMAYERRDVMYLWVKKDAWEQFQKAFELKIDYSNNQEILL